jgi:hypothetical protein
MDTEDCACGEFRFFQKTAVSPQAGKGPSQAQEQVKKQT